MREAIKNGASYCVISKKLKNKKNYIKVDSTMSFLNRLAKNMRDHSSAKFIAITGSTGKTTVKVLTGNLLKEYSETFSLGHTIITMAFL